MIALAALLGLCAALHECGAQAQERGERDHRAPGSPVSIKPGRKSVSTSTCSSRS